MELFRFFISIFFILSCTSSIDVQVYSVDRSIYVESSSDGAGIRITNINLQTSETIDLYAVKRAENGEFESNLSVSWELEGDIGQLLILSGGKSAKFEAQSTGSGKIFIRKNGVIIKSVDVAVSEFVNTVGSVNMTNITSQSFDITVVTKATLSASDSAKLYYCNHSKIPDCDPRQWYEIDMSKNGKNFEASSPSFKFPDDPKDEIKVLTSVTLNSGVSEQTSIVRLDGPAQIYRSIGINNTSALASRTSSGTNEALITDSVIVFDNPLAGNIGIGDAIVIDHSVTAGFEEIFFIRKRISANQFLLNDLNGAELETDYAEILNWEIYRAYSRVTDTNTLDENTGIPAEVRNFDTSQDAVNDNKAWHFAFYADGAWSGSGKNNISGWNLFGDNFLRFFVPFLSTHVGVSQRHSGKWDGTKAMISWVGSGNYQWPFMQRGAGKNAVRVEGFQFQIDDGGYANIYAFRVDDYNMADGAYAYFHHNIIRGVGVGGGGFSFVMGNADIKGYAFNNIAYDLGGTGFALEGTNSVASHNTSFRNDWNFLGYSGSGTASYLGNISHSSSTYEFRSSVSGVLSDYNISEDTTAPGANSYDNTTLGEIDFVDLTGGSEDLCITTSSLAYMLGPKMIEESDPFKIYYDAAGNLRRPSDTVFPLGACVRN